ncbi:aminotransferase-like domain-containing protein [Chitinasiproducens palmae]|nr:PLP-dependent aminotransferase family protein [Chitinasiproducens palmae]
MSDLSAHALTPSWNLSNRAKQITSSAIRDLLKITERPEIISFAGGLPSPTTFPVEAIRAAAVRALADDAQALQYAPTEGYAPLREWIAARHSSNGRRIDPQDVLITTGSQQALDLLGKTLIDPGSKVLVETPTYLGALQSFSMFEPVYGSLACDADGVLPDALDAAAIKGTRLLYLQPNFQNPTGRSMPADRRRALAALADRLPFPIVEDDPYHDLYFDGAEQPTLLSMAPERVVYCGSFSKIFAPGLRVGYVIAPRSLSAKLAQAKQASDLHTPNLNQRIIHEAALDGLFDRHLPAVRAFYAGQRDAMLAALSRDMPEGVTWNQPAGGMFVWLALPAHIDTRALLADAIEENVAFVPGEPFFANDVQRNFMRLSYATVTPARIDEGVGRLAALIRRRIGSGSRAA